MWVHGEDGGDRVIAMSQGDGVHEMTLSYLGGGRGASVLMHTFSEFAKQI